MGPLGAPTAHAGEAAQDRTAPSAPGLRVELLSLHLPPDFKQGVRLLLANTLLSDDFSRQKERRSNLLLASVLPPGLGAAAEVAGKSAALVNSFDERRNNS